MGTISYPKFLLFLFSHSSSLCFSTLLQLPKHNSLQRGSSLWVKYNESDFLTSPDMSFTCGFYEVGTNAYWFSIWFAHARNRTVIWMANRNQPVNGLGSRASLTRDGSLVLTDVDGTSVWKSDFNPTTANRSERAELLNSGNLVLKDQQGNILWQSLDFPTDTLLPNQRFTKGMKLVSNKLGRGNFGSGYYSLYFDNNVLRLMFDGPDTSSIYWPDPGKNVYQNGRTDYNSSRIAVLDDMGNFLSSDQLRFSAGDMGLGPKRRLTIDYDGNMRLYSLNATAGFWLVTWEALIQRCKVHGICGRNAICVYTPKPKCSCPPGYEMLNKGSWSEGCKPKFNLTCSEESEPVKFVEIRNMDFYGFDLNYSESTTSDGMRI